MGEYTEIEIYCSQMLRRRRGFPLYVPEPSPNLPAEYQRNGITIGDVGRVTPDGVFDFFFNIYLPAEHPVNAHTPDGFVPLALYDMIDLSRSTVTPGDYVTTPFFHISLTRFPGGAFLFNCFKLTGAILALPDGARREELVNLGAVRQYVVENAENWYRYVNGTRGRELKNGSLYLVTGWEKCKSWGMASFHDIVMPRNELQLTFRPSADMSSGYQYRWQTCPARHKHADPSPVGRDCLNQTVFIRGFSISLGETFWQKFFRGTSMRSITDAQLPNSHGSFVPFGFQGSALSWALNFGGSGGAGGRMHTESDEVILSDLSAASEVPPFKLAAFVTEDFTRSFIQVDWSIAGFYSRYRSIPLPTWSRYFYHT
ncbi:hypothetical protein FB45DRAFT_731891 [Roridomyces roridus]|uniref:Uncharacterized protein n=1 Tax=Roridomyces roridus TaxID=1738132 RepID=A0AAD7CI78_9AGAR|nr:hypothetical protein FB45DRAFT_731891 [Roridomyces roridus]